MRTCVAVSLWLLFGHAAFCERISAILNHPEKFDLKRVAVTGVAVGDWPDFEVYDSISLARRRPLDRALHVDAERGQHADVIFSMRRVSIVGIVHDRGVSDWQDRVSITAERVEVLSGQLAALQLPRIILSNHAAGPVVIRVFSSPYAQFTMQKDAYLELPFSGGVVEVTNAQGGRLARDRISNVRASPYFDRMQNALYYSVTSSSLTPVAPNRAEDWRRKAILSQYNTSKR